MAGKSPSKSPAKAGKKPSKSAGARRPKVKKSTSAPALGQAVDALKKGFLMGLGATAQTAEKLKDLVAPVVEEIGDSEARRTTGDLARVLLNEKTHFEARLKSLVEGFVRATVKSLNLVTRDELDAVRRELQRAAVKPVSPRPAPRSAPRAGGGGGRPTTRPGSAPRAAGARPAGGATADRPTRDAANKPGSARPKAGGRPGASRGAAKPAAARPKTGGGPSSIGARKPRPGKPSGGGPRRGPKP
ncbi:MAG: hypothetical protein IPK79_06360 [Vampirovibrionales bacterium]|nr:hypothetical protein [Vampirovibrionales bacterium]